MPARKMNKTVPITMRALIQRINRKLPKGEMLKAARSRRSADSTGWHFVIAHNEIKQHHVNVETLGRKLGVLADYERVE